MYMCMTMQSSVHVDTTLMPLATQLNVSPSPHVTSFKLYFPTLAYILLKVHMVPNCNIASEIPSFIAIHAAT